MLVIDFEVSRSEVKGGHIYDLQCKAAAETLLLIIILLLILIIIRIILLLLLLLCLLLLLLLLSCPSLFAGQTLVGTLETLNPKVLCCSSWKPEP